MTNTHLIEETLKNAHVLNPDLMKGFESRSDKDIPAFVPPSPPPMPTLENNSIELGIHSEQQERKLTGMDAVIAELNNWFESKKIGTSEESEDVSSLVSSSSPTMPESNGAVPMTQIYLQDQNLTGRDALLAELKEKLKSMFGNTIVEDEVDSTSVSVSPPPPPIPILATYTYPQAQSLTGRDALLAELKEKLKIMFGSMEEEDAVDSAPSFKLPAPPPMPGAKFNSIELATDTNLQVKSLKGRDALLAELKEKLKVMFGSVVVEDDVNEESSFMPLVQPQLDFDGTVKTMNS
ncbi:uncharacterized protein YfkK (UPF0435 family) [Providencia alcalifaciens]|nr:uncharacterized protein YfkK (UPF0435 family) [Providencia alcalifaciens]